MEDPKEFPYVLETSCKYAGAKVCVAQLRTRGEAADTIVRTLESGMEVIAVYKIEQDALEDFMNASDKKNWCQTCQEFLVNSDQARNCEDRNHFLTWKDPRPDESALNSSENPL